MWDILEIVGLIAVCVISLVMSALRLPGTWLIVASGLVYGWWDEWESVGLTILLILTGLALVGELAELGTSVLTARRAGASQRAAWGGLIGGLLGMFVFSIPIPLIGTVIGALLGCFTGAMIAELTVSREIERGAKVGFFAMLGFVLGTVAKLALTLVMSGILVTSVILPDTPSTPATEMTLPADGPSVVEETQ